MLDPHPPPTEVAWTPTGHPVRWFVAACAAIAVLATGVWWAGLVAPRLSTGDGMAGHYDADTGRRTVTVRLRNDSPVPVRIVTLTVTGAPDGDFTAEATVPDTDRQTFGEAGSAAVAAPFTLGGEEAAEVELTYRDVPCPTRAERRGLRVRSRTLTGLTQSADLVRWNPPPGVVC
jgi:hypothetical protein